MKVILYLSFPQLQVYVPPSHVDPQPLVKVAIVSYQGRLHSFLGPTSMTTQNAPHIQSWSPVG